MRMQAHLPFSKTLAITLSRMDDKMNRVSASKPHAALDVYVSFTLIRHAAPPD